MGNNSSSTRRVDALGRIVLPKDVRDGLALKENDEVDIVLDEGRIVITAHEPSCIICGAKECLRELNHKYICKKCLSKLKD